MSDKAPSITDTFRTKSGSKRHRATCRFARKNAYPCKDNPVDRKLAPCAVCKPHLAESKLPVKADKNLVTACGVCLKGQGLAASSKEAAVKAGFVVTRTGVKYHVAGCKHSKVPAALPVAA